MVHSVVVAVVSRWAVIIAVTQNPGGSWDVAVVIAVIARIFGITFLQCNPNILYMVVESGHVGLGSDRWHKVRRVPPRRTCADVAQVFPPPLGGGWEGERS